MKNFTLRTKTLLILGSVFVVSYLSIFLLSKNVLVKTFAELEQHQTLQSVGQVQNELQSQIDLLDALGRDWAWWDDTYDFAHEPNAEYIKSNLTDSSFTELTVNVIGIFDTEGNPLYLSSYDFDKNEKTSSPSWLIYFFKENPLLLQHDSTESGHTGIVLLPGHSMLFSSRPIITSELEGPIRGSFIFGRFISNSGLQKLSDKLGILLSVKRLDTALSDEEEQLVQGCLSSESKTIVKIANEKDIIAFKIIDDIFEKPGLLLTAKLRRSVYQQGQKTIKLFHYILLGMSALFCLIIIILLESHVLSHIRSLTQAVSKVAENPTQFSHVPEDGPLEVVTLATTINNMLNSISMFQSSIQNKKEELENTNKELKEQIIEREKVENEKILVEKRLLQAQKMEAIGTLAGGIAHDFNNLLSVILGYTDMAKEDTPPDSPTRSDLDKVVEAGNRAKDLVKQILTFSRQEEIERIPIQIQPLVKEALKMLRASIPTTIKIQTDIDSQCGIILADPTQVHQILMNLCTNAYHAMDKSVGVLKISLKGILIDKGHSQLLSGMSAGEYVQLTVADNGAGIEPDILDKIFDPYFTTKELYEGTGMGLAIVHGIITEYGGAIHVESALGKGTTFNVYFPVIAKQELQAQNEIEEIQKGHERILFIDDEKLLTEMGQRALERLGYNVVVPQSSLDALSIFQNNPDAFDVIITDETMPDMTGSELARRMLEIRPDIPIILCTGFSSNMDEMTAKSIGIKEFALKPISKTTIAQLIRKVLDTT